MLLSKFHVLQLFACHTFLILTNEIEEHFFLEFNLPSLSLQTIGCEFRSIGMISFIKTNCLCVRSNGVLLLIFINQILLNTAVEQLLQIQLQHELSTNSLNKKKKNESNEWDELRVKMMLWEYGNLHISLANIFTIVNSFAASWMNGVWCICVYYRNGQKLTLTAWLSALCSAHYSLQWLECNIRIPKV